VAFQWDTGLFSATRLLLHSERSELRGEMVNAKKTSRIQAKANKQASKRVNTFGVAGMRYSVGGAVYSNAIEWNKCEELTLGKPTPGVRQCRR